MILVILAMISGALGICFFLRIFVECFFNLTVLLNKKNYLDSTKQHHGYVINKKTKKAEADNSLILPF